MEEEGRGEVVEVVERGDGHYTPNTTTSSATLVHEGEEEGDGGDAVPLKF